MASLVRAEVNGIVKVVMYAALAFGSAGFEPR
jgi:hypothetical protein